MKSHSGKEENFDSLNPGPVKNVTTESFVLRGQGVSLEVVAAPAEFSSMSGNVLKATVPPVVEPALQYAFLFEFTGRSAVQKITLDFGAKSRIKTFAYWLFEDGGFGQKDIGNGRHTFPVDDDSGRDLKLLLLQVYTAAGEQAFLDNITW